MKLKQCLRQKKIYSENGMTLVELVVVLIIVGLIFPTIFSLAGMATVRASKYLITQEANYLAEMKMEEIIGYKAQHWDWYKTINTFAKTENLKDGFKRTVSIQKLNRWGKAQIDCWQVKVLVTHPQLKKGMQLSVRLTKYFEYGK